MSTYVVGDIHGCYSEWIELKNRIESKDADAKFILVGDFIDRGPEVIEMLQWAMENITPDGKYQSVVGNHEYMKIEIWDNFLRHRGECLDLDIEYKKHNFDLDDQYGFFKYLKSKGFGVDYINKVIDFFKTLPFHKEMFLNVQGKRGRQHFIVVHADYPWKCRNKDGTFRKSSIKYTKKYNPMKSYQIPRLREGIVWNRVHDAMCSKTKVIHGHTPTIIEDMFDADQLGKMYEFGCFYNIDCGLVFSDYRDRNLCALRLEDMKPIYLYEIAE